MNTQIEELLAIYLEGTLKEDEKQLLARMLKVPENQLYLASKIDKQFFDQSLNEVGDDEIGRQILQNIQQKLYDNSGHQLQAQTTQQAVQMAWYRKRSVRLAVAVAASIILVIR